MLFLLRKVKRVVILEVFHIVLSRKELLRDEHVTAAKETVKMLFWCQRIILIQTVSNLNVFSLVR